MTETPEIVPFETALKWRKWLAANHTKPEGIWMKFYKKASGIKSLTYAEALDEALCFGWIDGQSKSYDEVSWIQKFTPRRQRSMWSKRNKEHIARLIKEKKMTTSGLVEVERAKKDGRWDAAYDSPSTMTVPEDFLQLLMKNKKAHDFFHTLNKTNVYAVAWNLRNAKKEETKLRRMNKYIDMFEKGEKLH